MKNGQPVLSTQTNVEHIFWSNVGDDDEAMPVAELADLSGLSPAAVYQYRHEGNSGAAVALVMLGRERPEVAMNVCHLMGGTFIPTSAQQGHGNVKELLAIMAEAVAELTRMLIDGIFCHRDKARTHNLANRLMTRLALWRVANS